VNNALRSVCLATQDHSHFIHQLHVSICLSVWQCLSVFRAVCMCGTSTLVHCCVSSLSVLRTVLSSFISYTCSLTVARCSLLTMAVSCVSSASPQSLRKTTRNLRVLFYNTMPVMCVNCISLMVSSHLAQFYIHDSNELINSLPSWQQHEHCPYYYSTTSTTIIFYP